MTQRSQTKQALGNQIQVGAGTVLLPENALAAIEAGASFLATPPFLPEVVAVGNRNNVPVICGAFIKAGAYTVAIGSSLVNKELVQQADWNGLTNLARQFVQACTEG